MKAFFSTPPSSSKALAIRASRRARKIPDGSRSSGPPGKGPGVPRPAVGVDRPFGVSQYLRRTLDFAKIYQLHSATGGYTELYVVLNDAYHVDSSNSAIGYAKYMQFYSKCFVIGARVRVSYGVIADGAGDPPITASGLAVTTDSSSFATLEALIEGGFCRWKVTSSSPSSATLTESVDTGRFLHKPKVLDDPQLFSTASSSPGQFIVAHFGTRTLGTSYSAYVQAMVEVEMECVFTDPIVFS